jgi:hypothetical protein
MDEPMIALDQIDSSQFEKPFFHEFSRSKFLEIDAKQDEPAILTGEKGHRTAIISHGIGGRDSCSMYFEIEILPAKTPLPFVNIKPAVRVGFCNVDIQDIEMPLGSNKVSYCYSSNGKLITNSKSSKETYETYFTGDTVSVLINRVPNKP